MAPRRAVCLAEYSGQQASVMHKLCRGGILAAAAHTDAVLVGRCGRFDLLYDGHEPPKLLDDHSGCLRTEALRTPARRDLS